MKIISRFRAAKLACCIVAAAHFASAAELPFLHPLFSDGAVLQRDTKVPVWGWTDHGAVVNVSIANVKATAKADADGRWEAELPPSPAGGPHVLTVAGPKSVTVNNVLFGDVWLCSGQSNMDWGLNAATRGQEEIQNANYPKIRLMSVPGLRSARPEPTANLQWFECSPEGVKKAGKDGNAFSAAGYFFGRDLHRELNVPIGLIASAWGGTRIEPWSSARALAGVEKLKGELAEIAKDTRGLTDLEWLKKNDPGSANNGWAQIALDDLKWNTMDLPGRWESGALPNFDGAVWFRREVILPATWQGKEAFLDLGAIDDSDTAWFNGQRVGSSEIWDEKRHYPIPANLVKAGKNSIAVRVLDHGDGGGFFGKPESMKLTKDAEEIPLAGPWKYQVGVQVTEQLKFPDKSGQDGNPNRPTALYNGMIAPLEPFALKGFYWYQGEANVEHAHEYRDRFANMIGDLRRQFRAPNLPAVIVQLPNFRAPQQQPVEEGDWANFREAQMDIMRTVPNTMVVATIDIGEENDIHPGNKLEVGKRSALAALNKVYGKDIVGFGPIYKKMTLNGPKIVLEFDHAGKGLVTTGGEPLRGFAIAGADKNFVKANATIDGSKIVVSADGVTNPTVVRYNWATNPNGNLSNSAGLPASPFRTDH